MIEGLRKIASTDENPTSSKKQTRTLMNMVNDEEEEASFKSVDISDEEKKVRDEARNKR